MRVLHLWLLLPLGRKGAGWKTSLPRRDTTLLCKLPVPEYATWIRAYSCNFLNNLKLRLLALRALLLHFYQEPQPWCVFYCGTDCHNTEIRLLLLTRSQEHLSSVLNFRCLTACCNSIGAIHFWRSQRGGGGLVWYSHTNFYTNC